MQFRLLYLREQGGAVLHLPNKLYIHYILVDYDLQ